MAAQPQPRLTPGEYLELERASDIRHDYYNGRMYPTNGQMEDMAGGSPNHSAIKINLSGELRAAAKGTKCRVFDSDLRVAVSTDGLYTYPDITVVCGPLVFTDARKDTVLNPVLVVEVLSPSTESNDRGFKAAQYRSIATLQEYVLVSQTELRAEIYRRRAANEWCLIDVVGLEGTLELSSLGGKIAMAEIYDKVEFDAV